MKLNLEKTKKGLPAFWENGGAASNTGEAWCISDKHGNKKTAIYVRRSGHLANGYHALFAVYKYDYICVAYKNADTECIVYQINSIDTVQEDDKEPYYVANLKKICTKELGEWDKKPPKHLNELIGATIKKSRCYHCREMHYGKEKDNGGVS